MSQVFANGKTFNIEAYESNPVAFGALLARAKAEQGHALCRCATPSPLLVIRRKAGPDGDRYFLATWPNGGSDHNKRCRFFVSIVEYNEANSKRQSAILENEDGFSIKAGFSLKRMARDGVQSAAKLNDGHERAGGPQRDATGLLGTMHYLWLVSGLSRYNPPSKRRWGDIVTRLGNATAQGKLGQVPIPQVLYLVPPFHVERKTQIDSCWAAFLGRFRRTDDSVPMFLLLGEIKMVETRADAIVTHLRHHGAPLFMSLQLATVIGKRYPAAESALNVPNGTGRVIGLFQIELTERGNLWVNDAALMLVSSEYLPGDSSHEIRLAEKMVCEMRSFEKPMVIDAKLGTLPDFVLLDTNRPTYLEVWGMQTADYLERKREKIAVYRSKGVSLWQWDAVRVKDIPALPQT